MLLTFPANSAAAWIRPKYFEARFLSYLHSDAAADRNSLVEGRLNFEGRRSLAKDVEAYVSADLVADQDHLSAGALNQIHDRKIRRPAANITEAYLNFYDEGWDVRIGKQKISWGAADGLNPTDVFGAFDYADLLNPERLGIFGLRIFFYPDRSNIETWEFVCLPFYSPSRAGRANTRWRPILNGITPVPTDVRMPKNTPGNSDYGLRCAFPWKNWDVSANYSRVVDDLAGGAVTTGIFVTPLFLKKRVAGFDASRIMGKGLYEVHVEAAYTSTPSGYDDDLLQAVAGGRRAFTDFYHTCDLDLTLEWAGEHIYSHRKNPSVILRNMLQRPAPGSVLIDAKVDMNEFTSWNVTGIHTFRGPDAFLISSDLAWRATDLLELRFGFDTLSGDGGGTTQSSYEENDRWRIEVTIYFEKPPETSGQRGR